MVIARNICGIISHAQRHTVSHVKDHTIMWSFPNVKVWYMKYSSHGYNQSCQLGMFCRLKNVDSHLHSSNRFDKVWSVLRSHVHMELDTLARPLCMFMCEEQTWVTPVSLSETMQSTHRLWGMEIILTIADVCGFDTKILKYSRHIRKVIEYHIYILISTLIVGK